MPSERLNMAYIRGLDDWKLFVDEGGAGLAKAMTEYGLAHGTSDAPSAVGCLSAKAQDNMLTTVLVVRRLKKIRQLEEVQGEQALRMHEELDEKLIPCLFDLDAGTIQTFDGGAREIKAIGKWLSAELACPVEMGFAHLDMVHLVSELQELAPQDFRVKRIKSSDFCMNSYSAGPYDPKFMDTDHAIKFLTEQEQAVTEIAVTWRNDYGPCRAVIKPNGCCVVGVKGDAPMEPVKAIVRSVCGFAGLGEDRRTMKAVRDMIPEDGSVTVSLTRADGTSEKPVTLDGGTRERIDKQLQR